MEKEGVLNNFDEEELVKGRSDCIGVRVTFRAKYKE